PKAHARTGEKVPEQELPARLAQAMLPPAKPPPEEAAFDPLAFDATFTFSPREVLQTKDFATMSVEELAEVKRMLARLKLPLPRIKVRRTQKAARGTVVDLRATLRGMTGAAGAVAPLRFRAREKRTPP